MVSPSELRSPGIRRRFRGYEAAAVEQLLGDLAGKLDDAAAGRDALKERCRQLDSELGEGKSLDREMRETMIAAQRDIEQMEFDATREAASIRERARLEALEIDAGLEEEHAVVAARLAEVRAIEQGLRARSRELVQATLLELSETPSPGVAVEPAALAEEPGPSTEDTQAIVLPLVPDDKEPVVAELEDASGLPLPTLEEMPTHPRRRSFVLSFAILAVGTLVAVGIWQLSSAEGASKASAGVNPPASTLTVPPAEPVTASAQTDQATEAMPDDVAETVPLAAAPELAKLVIEATSGDCWLQVRRGSSNGKLLYDGFLYEGDREAFTAKRLWVRVGNGANVTASLNGASVEGFPAGTGDVVVTAAATRTVATG